MKDLTLLSQQPADKQLLGRAKSLCSGRIELVDEFNELVTSRASREKVHAFIEHAKSTAHHSLEERANFACKALGIESPTGQERLLALQVMIAHENQCLAQNLREEILTRKKTSDKKPNESSSDLALIAGILIAIAAQA